MKGAGKYPDDWPTIRIAAYARAGWKCEHCGMEFPEGSTKAKYVVRLDGKPVILTVHHLDGNREHNDWTNLLAVCQICHLHIQARWRPGWSLPWPQPPAWIIDRNLPYLVQLEMF